jgi:predicted ATP-dependent endonuclease of OLD family
MSNITKIKIKNLFGIREYEADGSSLELSGKNGTGKSSVLDAIKYALTNKSDRDYIVHKGETEGEIIVETDTGLSIDRKARTNKADYKSVKRNGLEVGSPEAFLRELFTPLQLNPIEFMNMDKKRQNAIILDMIEYPWDMNKIKEWFGEIPAWVSYDQNILSVLNDIQAENGDYYQNRRNIDRDIRNKKAFVEEIANGIPVGYDVEKWEQASAGDIYRQIERMQRKSDHRESKTVERQSR